MQAIQDCSIHRCRLIKSLDHHRRELHSSPQDGLAALVVEHYTITQFSSESSGNAIAPPSQAKVGRWRTRRDSNPRYRFRYTPLAGERFQPLSHRSRVLVDGRDMITFPRFRQWEACINEGFFREGKNRTIKKGDPNRIAFFIKNFW